jgi:uncharacterized protein YbaP (TraB family)
MKKRYGLLLSLSTALCIQSLYGQLLWSIEKKGLQQTSYLFGTFHQGDSSLIAWDDQFQDCFYSCSLFVGELDLTQTQSLENALELAMKMGMRDPNEIISPSLQDSINQITQHITTQFDEGTAQQLLKMKPILVQIQLMGLQRIKDGNLGTPKEMTMETTPEESLVMPDLVLAEKAQAANINVRGLETMEDQMNALFKIPMHVQWRSLYNELIHPDTNYTSTISLEKLQAIYKEQDLSKLNQFINDSELPTTVANELIVVRNYNMLQGIEEILGDQESVFFAVGAGHLGGPEGLIELLKKKNYQVKPVYFNWE